MTDDQDRQEAIEIFRQRCGDESTPPDLERFLAEFAGVRRAEVVEVVLVDQRLRWQSQTGPSVEEYLRRFPALAVDRQSRLDLVYGEMRAAHALNLPLKFSDYATRFPDLRDDLSRQLEVAEWFHARTLRREDINRPEDRYPGQGNGETGSLD